MSGDNYPDDDCMDAYNTDGKNKQLGEQIAEANELLREVLDNYYDNAPRGA